MKTKKIIASVLSLALVMSLTACDKAGEQVKVRAEEAAEAFASLDADDIADVCVEDDDFDWAEYGEAKDEILASSEVYEAILDTYTYTVDEESFEGSTKSGEASIDVVFSYVDYEALFEEEYDSVDELVDAIGDSEEMVETAVTFEFELDGEDWLVSNYEDILDEAFEFMGAEVPTFIDYSTFGGEWYFDNDNGGSYYNTDCIDYLLNAPEDVDIYSLGIYYTVETNGSVVYTSEPNSYDAWWYGEGIDTTATNGYLPSGSYKITFYDAEGTEITSVTATVTYEEAEPEPSYPTPEPYAGNYADVIDDAYWYTADVRNDDGTGTYYSGSIGIEYDIIPDNEHCSYDFYWLYYYEIYNNNGQDLIYTSAPMTDSGLYIESYFWASDMGLDELPDDTYKIIVYDMDGNEIIESLAYVGNV